MIKGLMTKWAVGTQRKEIASFVENMSAMDGSELGFTLAFAYHSRNQILERDGVDVSKPVVVLANDPVAPQTLRVEIGEAQKRGMLHDAAGLMVWLHSLRAMNVPELRKYGRKMWAELARGIPHIETAVFTISTMENRLLETDRDSDFPDGLSPEVS